MLFLLKNIDPLSVPKRRETSHRRVKGRSILDTLQSKVLGSEQTDDFDEATDSDTDPVWTPQKVFHISNEFSSCSYTY